ncbi:hypothetical protein NLI96_g8844 [Meripilus lineatus]|uniref:DUF1479-domain-containing protein n=1 Tax=Meripilus lineatus TaxID=2056292 RepID=A0AAD5UWI3_9APHY|nr:hypothetical protein NLI96_g8844 [Physisporinus lineatus]
MLFPKVLRVVYPLAGRYCTKRTFATGGPVLPASVGHLDSQSPPIPSPRTQKKEGTIEDVFSFNTSSAPLPQRFSQLKKDIFHLDLTKCWEEVLSELDVVTKHVAKEREKIIPQVQYSELRDGLSLNQISTIKKVGAVIVKDGILKEEALGWKEAVKDYAASNADKLKGSPVGNIVFYEIYNSKAQLAARSHPAVVDTQRFLLSLWHTSDPRSQTSLSTPISYFDRLRIRPPGPSMFTLGPHIDSGGLERWEDPNFRACFRKIFEGSWRSYDPYDATPRLNAKQDLYDAPNQCSIFRPWQGWTSLSTAGSRNGTLQLLPFLSLSTAYIMLRPFFRLRPGYKLSDGEIALAASSWELDLDGTDFPGNEMGKTQCLSEETHPHLRLDQTMVSIPQVNPGDQVYWHCDLIHAVESEHSGTGDSSVFYIPAAPLTVSNAAYLRDQRSHFEKGLPPPDFPGGEGEKSFKGRATIDDVALNARTLFGFEPFTVPPGATQGSAETIENANRILFA